MKTSTFIGRGLAGAVSVLTLASAQAAYNPAVVAADALWVVHADLAALREGTVGKELVAALEKAQSQATGGMVGIDIAKVLTTVGSLTAYGTNLSKEPTAIDGALVVQGTEDLRKIVESALLQGTLAQPEAFRETKELPFPAYAIAEPRKAGAAGANPALQVIVAFPPEPVILVSKSSQQLLKAHAVFRGSAPSMAAVRNSPLGRLTANGEGAYLFAASVVPSESVLPQGAAQARMLQLASVGSMAIGERGADMFAHADLVASSEENAEKLMKIIEGMTGILSLAESNDRQLAEFLKSRMVTRENQTVSLRLSYPSARIVQMVQTLRSQAETRPASRPQLITSGRVLAEWTAEPATDGAALKTRTIENVKLANGATITVGRALDGGREARFDRVEIVPAAGGSPLIFRSEFMRTTGNRGSMAQFQFPGVDGDYTIRAFYLNDPEGKARYAVSVREPRGAAPGAPAAAPAPATTK